MDESECLHQLFAAQASRTPDRVAVTDGRRRLTYRELDDAAGQLARRLRLNGVGPEVLVGLCVDRDVDLVVAILAVLQAGGAYVPLDPRYPRARLEFVLADCRCPVVLGQQRFAHLVAATGLPFVAVDAEPADGQEPSTGPDGGGVRPAGTAYVLHTSGSTGQPKGVMVSHANVSRLFTVTRDEFAFDPDDTWTLFHSFAFDFSVWEMWGALLHGGRLVVVPYPVSRDPESFWRLLTAERVTVLNQTPSAFRRLIRAAEADGWPETTLRTVVFGGEALPPAMLRPWFDRYGDATPRLVNMYGITETTVHVTVRPLTAADADGQVSPIGVPLDDLDAVVLGPDLRAVPHGEPGELFVGGAGVSTGYLGRPGLTARRFVPDPSGPPGARRYRTGDLAVLRDGELEFLGRTDDQVQFRGFRIEPAEIEAALLTRPGVSAAVVLLDDRDGEARLAGFVLAAVGASVRPEELRAGLAEQLPVHQVPSVLLVVDAFPLTVNGKLDRDALLSLARNRPAAAALSTSDTAGGEDADRLAAIWADVLGVARVDPHDNFFALGGDSMSAIRVVARARDAAIPVSVESLFKHPTVAELATAAGDDPATPAEALGTEPAAPADGVADTFPASLVQVGVVYECEITEDPTLYHDASAVRLSGPLDPAALRRALDTTSARHELLRACFDLVGHAEPMVLVHHVAPIPLAVLDAPAAPDPAAAVRAWWTGQWRRPFELTAAPLVRCHVLNHPDGTFHLALSVHHSVVDGWSFAVVMRDLLLAYDRELGSPAPAEPPLASRYRDFVALERRAAASPATTAYWTESLGSYRHTPLWTERPAGPATESTVSVPVDPALANNARQLAVRLEVPVRSVYLAAHVWALSVLRHTSDVLTGLVTNGRPEHTGAESAVGMFVNTLPLRTRLPDGSWSSLVRAVFAAEQAQLPHRRFPLAKLRAVTGVGPPEALFNFADFRVYDVLAGLRNLRAHEWWFADRNEFPLSVTVTREPMSPEWQLVVRAGAEHGGQALAETAAELFLDALGRTVTDPDGRVALGVHPVVVP
ncbi:non-ribosomal peptide synthetase [Lentzea waywayandensis]|uniref:non-ribosomal peptide synthetase n=1 Tax=Lentzea waywayandensis TaxID=84724 RepID=UPI0015A5889C|nr:non-ribosomal peptide synthetase [Lentzea waywayandensis]